MQATVELQGEHTRGQLVVEKRRQQQAQAQLEPNVDVIRSLDTAKVQSILFSSFG